MGLNSLNYLGRVDAVAKIEIVSAGKVDLRQEVKMIYDKLEGGRGNAKGNIHHGWRQYDR